MGNEDKVLLAATLIMVGLFIFATFAVALFIKYFTVAAIPYLAFAIMCGSLGSGVWLMNRVKN